MEAEVGMRHLQTKIALVTRSSEDTGRTLPLSVRVMGSYGCLG